MPDFDVAGNPALQASLRIAKAWGVPPTIFLGRKQATVYEYNQAGRIARTIADAAWTEADRELAAAWEAYEAGLCPGCSDDLDETMKPENEHQYEAECVGLCHKCVARRVAAELYEKGNNRFADMMLFTVRKKEAT